MLQLLDLQKIESLECHRLQYPDVSTAHVPNAALGRLNRVKVLKLFFSISWYHLIEEVTDLQCQEDFTKEVGNLGKHLPGIEELHTGLRDTNGPTLRLREGVRQGPRGPLPGIVLEIYSVNMLDKWFKRPVKVYLRNFVCTEKDSIRFARHH
jgi:hypothetical protein